MLKKNLKLLAILFIILTTISSFTFCFAEETNETVAEASATSEETSEEEIYERDLYLFDSNIVMDQLVDGNVYLMGNNITVSGQVNGNLFVFGNNVKFDNCYVRYSIYAYANNVYYNGAFNDLYVAAIQNLEMTYDSYVVRDVKAVSNSTILKAAVGRDVDLKTNSANFGADNEVPIIYGNLRYSANEEKAFDEGIVEGDITYSPNSVINNNGSVLENLTTILISFLTIVVTTLIIYAIAHNTNPAYVEKLSSNHSPVHWLKCFGIGLITIIVGIAIFVILLLTSVGAKLAFILALALILNGLLATPVALIYILDLLKPILKIEKTYLYYIVLALVAIIFQGITYIPFVGGLISFIILMIGYGLIINTMLPQKELSDEELQAKLAKKEEKQALKAQRKEEKTKLKAEKKAQKDNKKNEL